jgi:hypothetical protein
MRSSRLEPPGRRLPCGSSWPSCAPPRSPPARSRKRSRPSSPRLASRSTRCSRSCRRAPPTSPDLREGAAPAAKGAPTPLLRPPLRPPPPAPAQAHLEREVRTKLQQEVGGLRFRLPRAFERAFRLDAQGLPRAWGARDDVTALCAHARDEALALLALYRQPAAAAANAGSELVGEEEAESLTLALDTEARPPPRRPGLRWPPSTLHPAPSPRPAPPLTDRRRRRSSRRAPRSRRRRRAARRRCGCSCCCPSWASTRRSRCSRRPSCCSASSCSPSARARCTRSRPGSRCSSRARLRPRWAAAPASWREGWPRRAGRPRAGKSQKTAPWARPAAVVVCRCACDRYPTALPQPRLQLHQ